MESNNQIKISVVTIVFNGAKTLERCIKSVVKQLTPEVEYIIIDGGSTDGSLSIIKDYEKYLSSWISEKDRNIAHAFNKGIEKSNGEYVSFLNADDWYNDGIIEFLLNSKFTEDILHGKMQMWKGGIRQELREGNHHRLNYEMTINHPATFMKLSKLNELEGFTERYSIAMDYDLFYRSLKSNYSFRKFDFVATNMSWGGVSTNHWLTSATEVMKIKNDYSGKRIFHKIWFIKQILAIQFSMFRMSLKSVLRTKYTSI